VKAKRRRVLVVIPLIAIFCIATTVILCWKQVAPGIETVVTPKVTADSDNSNRDKGIWVWNALNRSIESWQSNNADSVFVINQGREELSQLWSKLSAPITAYQLGETGSISILSADALCYSDVTVIVFKLKLVNTKCWFDRQVTVNGQRYPSGPFVCWQPEPPEDHFGCETPPLPQGITGASIAFTPNISKANKAGIDQIWDKPVRFCYVTFQRRELGFSLIKWRADQKIRDEAAASNH
jgi:hypothetical protein